MGDQRHININAMPRGQDVLRAAEPLRQGQERWNETQGNISAAFQQNERRAKDCKHMVNSSRKGKDGERELANILSELFGVSCVRGQQRSGRDEQDVVGLPGCHIECKRGRRPNIRKAFEQAVNDAGQFAVPMVFSRDDRGPWLVTLALGDLPDAVSHLFLPLASEGESSELSGSSGK